MVGWLRWTALGIAGLTVGASPARALETGQCLPAAQVRAALAEQQQHPIILGNRTGYGYPTALIFFANADGSKGYLVRGDKPLGQEAETACIDSVYRDVRLNDIGKPGIPPWAMMRVDAAQAIAICKRDRLGYQEECLPHDAALANLERGGLHMMFRATGVAINPRDNSVRDDQRLIVAVGPRDGKGIVDAVTAEGADYMLSAYTSASYTQFGQALLGVGN